MFYKNLRNSIVFIIILILAYTPMILNAGQIPDQPLTAPLAAKAGIRIVTADWLLNMPKLSYEYPVIRWLDNTYLIYSFPPVGDNQKWKIEALNTRTREHKLLGEGSIPKASPDGQWIAFIRGEEEAKQLWIMRNNGKGAKQLSSVQGGLGFYQFSYDFSWSPDSKRIALEHQPLMMPWENKQRPKSMIDVIDVATEQSKQIASFDAALRYLSWHPNNKELLFMKERNGVLYNDENDHAWVQCINVNNGQRQTLAQFDAMQQFLQPNASPDGRSVALMYDADNPIFNFMPSIGLVSTDFANRDSIPPIIRLTYEIKLDSPLWSKDGQQIYARRDYGAYKQIYSINAKTGIPKQITNAPLNIESYALSPDGKQLAWIGQDAQATRVIRIASSDGHNVQDIAVIPGVPNDMALSEVREIDWKTSDYPAHMRGLLFLPLNYQKGHHYPLIVDIHGGDTGAHIYMMGGVLVTTPLEWHMWTAKGYAVFVPEFRSSASFGSLAVTRDLQEHDRLDGDLKDIEAGIDVLIANGIADKNRLAVIGHSAGGLRANWFTAVTHRYRAIVSKEGWADELIPALNNPPSKRIYFINGGSPWEVPQNYLKNSSLYHSAGATTPTLFFMGNPKLGGADKYGTVNLLYHSLKTQGVETQYIKYLDEGHVFEKPANRRDVLERTVQWIDEHIKNKS